MVKPRGPEELKRVHIWLSSDDIERIHKYFGDNLGFSRAVRRIVSSYLNNLENRAHERIGSSLGLDEVDLELDATEDGRTP